MNIDAGSRAPTISLARISSPLWSATPVAPFSSARIRSTGVSVRISPPWSVTKAASAPVTAPIPPMAR